MRHWPASAVCQRRLRDHGVKDVAERRCLSLGNSTQCFKRALPSVTTFGVS